MNAALKELSQLEIDERIRLVQDLWDSIAVEAEKVPVEDWQKEELDRRKEKYQKNPSSKASWQQIKARIKSDNA